MERSEQVIGAEIFAICYKHPSTVEQLTNRIYRNTRMRNIARIYLCVERLLKHGVLVPMFKNNSLYFKVDNGVKN